MNNCKTCKYWTSLEDCYATTGRPDVPDMNRWSECLIGGGKSSKPNVPETLVFAIDGSSYQASLITREDFGCVLHEEK